MKLFGILLIVAAGLGMGIYYARRLYKRAEWLQAVESLLCAFEERLVFSAAPLVVLWKSLAQSTVTAAYPLVQTTADGLRQGMRFEKAFCAALDEAQAAGWLLDAEREWLDALAGTLGRGNLEGQTAYIRRCREGLARASAAAWEHARSRGAIYRMVGLSGGVCVALVLL